MNILKFLKNKRENGSEKNEQPSLKEIVEESIPFIHKLSLEEFLKVNNIPYDNVEEMILLSGWSLDWSPYPIHALVEARGALYKLMKKRGFDYVVNVETNILTGGEGSIGLPLRFYGNMYGEAIKLKKLI